MWRRQIGALVLAVLLAGLLYSAILLGCVG